MKGFSIMRDHIKILGILSMILGGFGLVAAIGIFALFGGLAGVAGFSNNGTDGLAGAGFLAAIGLFLAIVIGVISLPQLIGGWGLINYKPWARILMIVVSVISLLHIPLGTALGVYGLWALLNDEAKYLFATGGRPPVPYAAESTDWSRGLYSTSWQLCSGRVSGGSYPAAPDRRRPHLRPATRLNLVSNGYRPPTAALGIT